MPVAPLLEALVDVDHPLADHGRLAVVTVRREDGRVNPGRLLHRQAHVALEPFAGNVVASPGQVGHEGVVERGTLERGLDAAEVVAALLVSAEHGTVSPPEHGLELPELPGLEAARRLEPVAEAEELRGLERLDDVELRHDELQDREDPLERAERLRAARLFEQDLEVRELVEQLLEPELVHLVDDDEEHLVVLVRARSLRAQDLVEREVGRVGQGLGLLGHTVSLKSSRAMISRCTSEAPS